MSRNRIPNEDGCTRREFFGRLGAGALMAGGLAGRRLRAAASSSWTPPPTMKNPNILVIMVDQLRPPMWMSDSQSASLTQLLPNIMGRIQNSSYNFEQYFV